MKMELLLQRDPDPKFAGGARSIAQGDAPKWLVVGLTYFSPGIGSDDTPDVDINTVVEHPKPTLECIALDPIMLQMAINPHRGVAHSIC